MNPDKKNILDLAAVRVGFYNKNIKTPCSIRLTLVRSCTASKADLKGVLLASWKPPTSTCKSTEHLAVNPG